MWFRAYNGYARVVDGEEGCGVTTLCCAEGRRRFMLAATLES